MSDTRNRTRLTVTDLGTTGHVQQVWKASVVLMHIDGIATWISNLLIMPLSILSVECASALSWRTKLKNKVKEQGIASDTSNRLRARIAIYSW